MNREKNLNLTNKYDGITYNYQFKKKVSQINTIYNYFSFNQIKN
jgi:hypothetical protein